MSHAENEGVEALRSRLHKLHDMVQTHEGTLREHGVRLELSTQALNQLRDSAATQEQVENAVTNLTARIDGHHTENSLRLAHFDTKLDHVRQELRPIKTGIYWVVGLVMAAVITAILTLILAGPPPVHLP